MFLGACISTNGWSGNHWLVSCQELLQAVRRDQAAVVCIMHEITNDGRFYDQNILARFWLQQVHGDSCAASADGSAGQFNVDFTWQTAAIAVCALFIVMPYRGCKAWTASTLVGI